MSRSVEQALASLIPRHNGALPPELLELASSLLAQSRNKASNLKADEEIGRTYACANIACERLKQSLNLPKIEPRPPCPPRVYNKLYSYFDDLLVPPKKRGRPPKPKPNGNDTSNSNPSTPTKLQKTLPARDLPSRERPTPTKASSLAPYRTTPSRPARRGLQFADSTNEIPAWIHPTIRAICKELKAERAAPHILAGVTTILTLPSPSTTSQSDTEKDKKNKLPALVAATYFFVSARLSGRETSGKEYITKRTSLLKAFKSLRDNEALRDKILRANEQGKWNGIGQGRGKERDREKEEELAWQGWEPATSKDIDNWLLEISTRGWLTLDWFTNIVEGAGLQSSSHDPTIDKDDEMLLYENDEPEEGEQDALRTGLGTMMQDRVDYLSEKRRRDYAVWKKNILARCEEIEAAVAAEPRKALDADEMDTDDG